MLTELELNETAFETADESLTQNVTSTDVICMFILGVLSFIPKARPVVVRDWEPVEASAIDAQDVNICRLNENEELKGLDAKLLDEMTTDPTKISEPAMILHISVESECHIEGAQEDLPTTAF